MDNTIKSLTITGSAAEDAMKPRRGSRRKRPEQEHEEEDTKLIENAKRIVFGQKATVPVKPQISHGPQATQAQHVSHVSHIKNITPNVTPNVIPQPTYVKHPDPVQSIEGKVILNPPKHQRVKLQPKHHSQPSQVNQTRKARRIHLVNLTHRFTRAKRVHDDTEKKSMDTIREYLIQKGVIQAKSKAPEKMLRSMYSDFMLLKDQAL
jgi:hypothetical protein